MHADRIKNFVFGVTALPLTFVVIYSFSLRSSVFIGGCNLLNRRERRIHADRTKKQFSPLLLFEKFFYLDTSLLQNSPNCSFRHITRMVGIVV